MSDSSSFTSLLALVDSHLSNTKIQTSRSEDPSNASNRIPLLSLSQSVALSDTTFSFTQRIPIPSFNLSKSPIQNVLAEQVTNMLRAKELKKQLEEEKHWLAEEIKKINLEENDEECVIDLMQAIETPCARKPIIKEEDLSLSSSFESLFEPKFTIELEKTTPEQLLPCTTDMSYILHQHVLNGKCSPFGKVLTSRLRPTAAPYLKENIESKVVPFDFTAPSPCDIIKEKLRKPTTYCTYQQNIFSIF